MWTEQEPPYMHLQMCLITASTNVVRFSCNHKPMTKWDLRFGAETFFFLHIGVHSPSCCTLCAHICTRLNSETWTSRGSGCSLAPENKPCVSVPLWKLCMLLNIAQFLSSSESGVPSHLTAWQLISQKSGAARLTLIPPSLGMLKL